MNSNRGYGGFGRFSIFPPVLKSLLIINVIVFAFQLLFLDFYSINGVSLNAYFHEYFALQPVFSGMDGGFDFGDFLPWQLLSYQFMHSGFMHLGFNMLALWMFGSELETMWGSRRFMFYYLLCGIGAGIIHLFVSPLFSDPAPAIGASGAVYGILLAFGMTFPDRPIFMFPFFIPIPAKFFVMIFAGIELLSGISSSDGIAHFAHLGGAATGFFLIKLGDKLGIFGGLDKLFKSQSGFKNVYHNQPTPEPSSYHGKWHSPGRVYEKQQTPVSTKMNVDGEDITQEKIDVILDKISDSGYQNLSEREKRILFELSQKLK